VWVQTRAPNAINRHGRDPARIGAKRLNMIASMVTEDLGDSCHET